MQCAHATIHVASLCQDQSMHIPLAALLAQAVLETNPCGPRLDKKSKGKPLRLIDSVPALPLLTQADSDPHTGILTHASLQEPCALAEGECWLAA